MMKLTTHTTAALVADFQEHLMPAIYEQEQIIKSTCILLQGLNLLQIPMLLTRQYPQGLGDTVAPISQAAASASVFDKTSFSCYVEEPIRKAMVSHSNILLCGVEAHICCFQTALDFMAHGHNVFVVTDCVGSRRPSDKKIALKRLIQEGAFLTTYETVLMELIGGYRHPAFRDISRLIK
jgi:nicotinamidase-related amidase